jgi:glycosyltransferase involved in cell wall biosynthesis
MVTNGIHAARSLVRICFVSKEVGGVRGGGIGTYVAEAARALTAAGHEVWLLTEDCGLDATMRAALESVEGFHRIVQIAPASEPRWFHAAERHGHAHRVHEALLTLGVRFDYIEFADYHAEGAVALREQRLFRAHGDAVMTVTLHTPSYECYRWNEQLHRAGEFEWETFALEEQAIRDAPFLNAPSQAMRDAVCSRLSLDPSAVAIVPYPMRAPAAPPLTTRRRLDELEFVFVGRVEPRKGLTPLLDAFRLLPDLRLRIVGGDTPFAPMGGSYRAWLQSRASSNTTFVGPLSRAGVAAELARADVCVLPSAFENWPNACLEAMLAGRVVLGSAHGGMAEMIEDGVSGLLVDGRSADAIADGVRRLATMLAQLPGIGAAAAARASELASPDRYVARIEAVVASRRAAMRPLAEAKGPSTVSIVVPFHRDGDTIDEAVDSAIAQSHGHIEVVVVDDGSPLPGADAILERQRRKDPRVRVLRKPNGGLSSARNHGIAHMRGELLLFLDADNVLDVDYAKTAADVLARSPESGFVVPYVRFQRPDGSVRGVYNPLPFQQALALRMNRFGDAGACFRAAVFADTGVRYDERLVAFEDWALWLDLHRKGVRGTIVPRVLYCYRERDGSMVQSDGWRNLNAAIGLMIADHLGADAPGVRDLLFGLQQTWGVVAHEREAQVQSGRGDDATLQALQAKLDQSYRDHMGTMAHRDHLLREIERLRALAAAAGRPAKEPSP